MSKGFWIDYEENRILNLIGFQMAGNMNSWIGVIANILIFGILAIIIFRNRNNKNINWKPIIYSLLIYLSVILVALIITQIINTSILYYRYLFVINGLYLFIISHILSKENNKYIIVGICTFIFILGVMNNAIQIMENYDKNNGKQIEYLENNIKQGDIIVYEKIEYGSIFAVNFKNNKQFFYNPQNWEVKEAYKAWAPQLEVYITKDFLKDCKGRVWIIDTKDSSLYNKLFNNEEYKYKNSQYFESKYKKYEYNLILVERIQK